MPAADARRASLTAEDRSVAERLLPPGGRLPALDVVARLAARLLGAGSAQVSLLTDVQTVAGGTTPPSGDTGDRSPLEDSLCTVTAGERVALAVPDARADARVATLPPVTGGAVGAYLGVPLLVEGNAVAGVLCVFDPEPRPWTDADVAMLEQLGEWVVAELQLAALGAEHERTLTRSELAIDAAGIGSFDWDLLSGHLSWDDRLLDLFGYDRGSFPETIDAFNARVHPGDVARVGQALQDAIDSVGTYESEYRVTLPSGATRWVRARGRVLGDLDGRAVRMIGAALDTTQAHDADLRISRALESMSSAFVSLDAEWRLTYVNAEAERILGMPRGDMLGKVHWDLFPHTVGSEFEETYRRVAATGVAETLEAYYPEPIHSWFDVRVSPQPEGLTLSFVDVTAGHDAAELVRVSTSVAERLSGTFDLDASVGELARLVVPRLADWSIVSLVGEDGKAQATSSWHVDPAMRPIVERYSRLRLRQVAGTGTAHEATTTREPKFIESGALQLARETIEDPEVLALVEELRPESAALLPLDAHGRSQGLLMLFRPAERSPMNPEEVSVARSVAGRAALALDNARLYAEQRATAERLRQANRRLLQVAEHDRTVAQALQAAMLTRLPEPDHLHLVARYLTASGDEQVGGDWYDAVVLPSGATTLVIGDVVGHDIEAAAIMGQLRNMLRTLAWDRDEPPSATVTRLDRAIRDLRLDTFATLLMLRIEQDAEDRARGERRLRWTSAGHPAPLLLHADGRTEVLTHPTGVLLGIAPESERHDHVHQAPLESTLLLYTDGLVETRDQDVSAGQRRLGEALTRHRALEPDELLDAILADMVGDDPDDDVAVLAVRFHSEEHPRPAAAGSERP